MLGANLQKLHDGSFAKRFPLIDVDSINPASLCIMFTHNMVDWELGVKSLDEWHPVMYTRAVQEDCWIGLLFLMAGDYKLVNGSPDLYEQQP